MEKKSEIRIQNTEWLQRYSKFFILTPVFFIVTSCSSVAQKNGKPYYEDLSKLRPKVELPVESKKNDTVKEIKHEVSPTKNINAKVDVVLDSIDRFNLTRKFLDGFTIQIYSGQKKEDAMNAMKKMKEEVPELTASVKYEQPKFRVIVGRYFTRLEAQSDLLLLKRKFSTASLVPEKISIK
ncbi:MAG: SPOR domain-containing protein [Bacteroidetes bacterium]|nr:SPOR domain-containing protein [Bacteroidota bacterium]